MASKTIKMTKVTMNLSNDELALIASLRASLGLTTNTGTVGMALRLSALLVDAARSGKTVALLDSEGRAEARIAIPGVTKSF